jgi:hypothetical protein
MADYQPWKKLPFRENERIARVINLIIYLFDIVWPRIFKDVIDVETRIINIRVIKNRIVLA